MRVIANTKRHIEVSTDSRYLAAGEVRERFGVSDMWIWRYMRDHGFPKPVQFGGPTSARHWLLADIQEWERSKTAVSRAGRIKAFSSNARKADAAAELKELFKQQQA